MKTRHEYIVRVLATENNILRLQIRLGSKDLKVKTLRGDEFFLSFLQAGRSYSLYSSERLEAATTNHTDHIVSMISI